MTLSVIGAGLGRTGTMSLKLALNRLGFGECHHMEVVLRDMGRHVPLWNQALAGKPDWRAVYDGFQSAVDWPTARFFRELGDAYPAAKFVLTVRTPQSWADSFSSTIQPFVNDRAQAPAEFRAWLDMVDVVLTQTGFPGNLIHPQLIDAFHAHNEAVKTAIPADRLLIFEVKQGWRPLCDFLGIQAPNEPFPRTNSREEFWDLVRGNT